MNVTSLPSARRYDFDWLRVLLIFVVFLFHSLMIFGTETFAIKNAANYFGAEIVITFLSRWMMPGIFLISGVATFYALGKRSASTFLKDRALRLLVPLAVGACTHAALQVYLERVSKGTFNGTFWQYYLTYFNGLDRLGGDFSWMGKHLWYLELLFIFSVICLPLFIWLRHGAGQRVLAWLGEKLSKPGAVYLLALPTLLIYSLVDPNAARVLTSPEWGGWNTPNHLVFFLSGFLLASSLAMQASIRRLRWVSLAAGLVTFVITGGLYAALGEPDFGSWQYLVLYLFSAAMAWAWLLAITGFGMQRLNVRTPALDYASEAVLPFYILHQTVLVCVAFYVVNWAISDFFKWIIIVVASFAIIMALYEFLVRRWNGMRFLFGMKLAHRERVVEKPAVQVS